MRDGYVAKYLRISDDDGDIGIFKNESDSITNQRNVIHEFISHDGELIKKPLKEFCDDGYSGVNFKRPGIQALLKGIRENKIACVIVKDFSRLGRNYIEVGDYLEQIFPFFGVRFISIADNFDSDKSTGGIDVGFKTLMHDLYSRDLSKKVKSVKRMHQEAGKYSGGGVPFGYVQTVDKGLQFEIDLEAEKVVKDIFRLAVCGHTTGSIAKRLNERKVPTPGAYSCFKGKTQYTLKNNKNNFWTATQVREVIQNETYIGTYVCRKMETVRVREVQKTSPDEYKKFPNAHKAIVTRDVFEQAQKAIIVRGERGAYKKEENVHVLMGKVKCGHCGYSLNRITRVKQPYYTCRMGDSCGSSVRINVEDLNQIILESLWKLVAVVRENSEVEVVDRKKALSILSRLKDEKRILGMKIERYKNDKLHAYSEYKRGGQSKDEFLLKQEKMNTLIRKYIKSQQTVDEKMELLITEYSEKGQSSLVERYSCISELTRPLVEELIDRIDIYASNRVEIKWKYHEEFGKITKSSEKPQIIF